jgi:hypothetical protein
MEVSALPDRAVACFHGWLEKWRALSGRRQNNNIELAHARKRKEWEKRMQKRSLKSEADCMPAMPCNRAVGKFIQTIYILLCLDADICVSCKQAMPSRPFSRQ